MRVGMLASRLRRHATAVQLLGVALVASAAGCQGPFDAHTDGSGAGGKADGETDACQAEHDRWLLLEYAPLGCDDGPTCVGRASLDSRPSCEGAPDHATWMMAYDKHIFAPWLLRYNAARNDFMMRSSAYFEDHDRFVEVTAPTEAEAAAHAAMLAVPFAADAFDYKWWLGRYETLLLEVGFPLRSQNNLEVDGREVCGDPFEGQPFACPYEPALLLDSSEETMLSWFEDFMPAASNDGLLAEWSAFYYAFLASGATFDLIQFEFPLYSERGLAHHELAFFERLRGIRPAGGGAEDSQRWLSHFLILLETAELSLVDQELRVELFEASRPEELVGLAAYETWLGIDRLLGSDDLTGFAGVSDDDAKLDRLLAVKPCARDEDELAAFAEAFASYDPDGPTADLALAAPERCPAP